MTENPYKPDAEQDAGPDMLMAEARMNPVNEDVDDRLDASSSAAEDARRAEDAANSPDLPLED